MDKVKVEFERYKQKIEKENLKKRTEKFLTNKNNASSEISSNESELSQENQMEIQLKSLKNEFDIVSNRLREKYDQQTKNIYVESMKIIKDLKMSSINAVNIFKSLKLLQQLFFCLN